MSDYHSVTVDPVMGDIYSIHWEPEMLRSMGDTITFLQLRVGREASYAAVDLIAKALTQGLQQLLGSTILVALMAAIQAAYSLIDRNLGSRPITLVGFSIGSRVIFSALKELAKKGALGIVQNVYLFGSPIVVKKDEYLRVKSVVAGTLLNGYATNELDPR
ncbi:hypothetical protein MRB53_036909 [Persea americana]|nr:hypothetical protein MRB53_036909 [Persea americana]